MTAPLWLYSAFHFNLAFSSIPTTHYPLILDRCYWPLLDIAKRLEIPLGIEATGYSLERLNEIDPSFTSELKRLWHADQIEFIGASYTQSIFPLTPAEVNRQNLILGNEIYESLLGKKPITAYVNEQTYSSGTVDLYLEAGYRHLVMEYNNPARYNVYPPLTRYRPQKVLNPDGSQSITVVWNDSMAFQKFQRYLNQTLTLPEYQAFLDKHLSALNGQPGALPWYGSDAEIIDYHPGQLEAEYLASESSADLGRLISLLETLKSDSRFAWTTPSGLVEKLPPAGDPIRLESPEYPLPCKKQPKYNPTRWAMSGRENVQLNTRCFERYFELMAVGGLFADKALPWRYLLEKWASDFRTHTTEEKMSLLRQRASTVERFTGYHLDLAREPYKACPDQTVLYNPNTETSRYGLTMDVQFPPHTIYKTPQIESSANLYAWQLEGVGHYQDGSVRWAKVFVDVQIAAKDKLILQWVSGESQPRTETSLTIDQDDRFLTVGSEALTLKLMKKRGGAIAALTFNQLDSRPWLGTLEHGTFEDIGLAADFYSGHFVLTSKSGEKATDLNPCQIHLPDNLSHFPVRVPIKIGLNTTIGPLWKTLYLYREQSRLDLLYHFKFRDTAAASCRVGVMTVMPDAFDLNTLAYRTVNGGIKPESFKLKGHRVTHADPVSVTVSAQHGVGASEGWLAVEDHQNRIILRTHPSVAYSMPMIHFEEAEPSYFLRVQPSIGEFDDTSHLTWRGHHQVMFTWQGQRASDAIRSHMPIVSLSTHCKILPV